MPPKKKASEPVVKSPSAAEKVVAFMKENNITMSQSYTLSIADKFKNVVHPAIQEAIAAGMIVAKLQLSITDKK